MERVESDELNLPETLEMQMSAPVGFSLASNEAMTPHPEQGCLPIGPSYAKVSLRGDPRPHYWVSQPSNTLGPIISTVSHTEIRPLWQWRKEYHDMVGLRTTKKWRAEGLARQEQRKADDRTEGRAKALVEISSALRGNTDPELVELFERGLKKGIIQDDALFI